MAWYWFFAGFILGAMVASLALIAWSIIAAYLGGYR